MCAQRFIQRGFVQSRCRFEKLRAQNFFGERDDSALDVLPHQLLCLGLFARVDGRGGVALLSHVHHLTTQVHDRSRRDPG